MDAAPGKGCRLCGTALAAGTVLVCLSLATGAWAASQPAGSTPPQGSKLPAILSNETTFTRWANPASTSPILSEPRKGAHVITHLHYQTEDRQAEVYLALRSQVDEDGQAWILIRIPGRPNGRKGWVRQDDLNPLTVIHTMLKIDRGKLRATLYKKGRNKKGRKIWSAPVGVGRPSLPTPAGHFWVREKLRSLGPVYGPWAIGTSAYSPKLTDWPGGGVVGIHGTNQPELIPGRPSHGCVRVKNKAISKLVRIMPLGTPIEVV